MSVIRMNQTSKSITFDYAFDQFIRKCKIKNLTKESISSYQQKVTPFREYLEEKDILISDIDSDTIDDFILWLKESRNINDITRNTYLRSVRAFCYYCMERGFIPTFKICIPKAIKKAKETYSNEELAILLKKPNLKECGFSEYKTWVFENFLLGTGVRISTALDIRIKDVDFDSGYIFLGTTKNRTQQYIPLSEALGSVLSAYLDVRGNSPDDYLFCDRRGNKADRRTYQELVAKYNRSRGVQKTSCHLFRHTYAKLSVLAGIDVFRLQKLMGHSTISVTKEYVDLFGSDLATDYDKYNPLDNLLHSTQTIKMKNNKKR